MSDPVVVALITGPVSAAVTLLLTKMLSRRRDDAEIDALLSERWEAWSNRQDREIADLRARVDRLEEDLADARRQNRDLEAQNRRQASLMTAMIQWALQLRDEVIRLGGHPPAAPPEVEAALTSLDPS